MNKTLRFVIFVMRNARYLYKSLYKSLYNPLSLRDQILFLKKSFHHFKDFDETNN